MENIEIVDVEPLIIELGEEGKWVHPYIKTWYQPEEDNEYDDNIYRIYINNSDGKTIYVFFKSVYLDKKLEEWTGNSEDRLADKQSLFEPPYIDAQQVFESLVLTLTEDFWCPGPNNLPVINNSRDYEKVRLDYPAEQFCFTEFGRKISTFVDNDVSMNFFSLDCGLTTDGVDWWCDS
jgi:hypothetical protein